MTSKNILDQREFKARELLAMHGSANMLVLPDAWDAASARILALCGFRALATTSAGISFSLGYPDAECIPRAEMMAAIRVICCAFHGPVTADLEGGYGRPPMMFSLP
jgi:2-methylisocitrate lyase-like PEP mutase family enzyme